MFFSKVDQDKNHGIGFLLYDKQVKKFVEPWEIMLSFLYNREIEGRWGVVLIVKYDLWYRSYVEVEREKNIFDGSYAKILDY